MMRHNIYARISVGAVVCLLGVGLGVLAWASERTGAARLLPAGDGLEIEYQLDGDRWTEIIPIFRDGSHRYFSAGIGMAERQVAYPAFPLKIVLTAGGKPFVAHVDIHLVQTNGPTTLSIPADRVTGPWLFVDVPPGVYEITGHRGEDRPRVRGVTVVVGRSQTAYVRFTEDRRP